MSRIAESVTHWLKRVITQPGEELDRWQRAARFVYDIGRFGARQLQSDRAPEMSAALSFRTLFGLLPVLVVATVLVRAFGMEQHYLEPLQRLCEAWGLDQVLIVPQTGPLQESKTLAVWLQDRVQDAEMVTLAAIGWVGVIVTIYAAISLMVTIEECFNTVYRAAHGRAWVNRVPVYWFLLTISPLLIIGSSYVDAWFRQWLERLAGSGWLSTVMDWGWSTLAFWLLMLTAYLLFPYTKVRVRPALIGALVAAVLLEIGKRTMGMYLRNALSLSQLYGSLGLVPLFMFWVYLMWLAVLFGLQVSATLQHLHGRRLEELAQQRAQAALVEASVVVVIMQLVGRNFLSGRPADVRELAGASGVPEGIVQRIANALIAAGLLHRVADAESRVVLGRPPQQVAIERLLAIGHELVGQDVKITGPAATALLDDVRRAQRAAAGQATLADLIG